ncbi:MAG: hypothetical protein ACRENQ_14215 [Gemmatimonadaceae bacterium]
MVITQRLDSLGQVESSTVTPPPGANPALAQAYQPGGGIGNSDLSLPARPVRIGGSWTHLTAEALPGGTEKQALRGTATYRLERLEHEGGDRVAIISSTMPFVAGGATAAASGQGVIKAQYRLDLDSGRLLRATTDMTMQIKTSAGDGSSHAHSVIEQLR